MREWSPVDVLADILNDVPDLVFAFTSDGRYLFINAAAAEFLGTSAVDVIGRHWRDLGYSADVMQPLAQRIAAVGATGRPERHRVTSVPERGLCILDISLTPLWSDEGNVLAVLAIAHDITEFVSAEALASGHALRVGG